MVSCDCEMVITTGGLQLARASVVDSAGSVLMDELVVPPDPIVDHNTKYSGEELCQWVLFCCHAAVGWAALLTG